MTNSSFSQTDEQTKLRNLADVLDKRCRGFLKYDVLLSVVNRIDPRKQMSIDVMDETLFKTQAKTKTTIVFSHGDMSSVRLQWGRCLLGSVQFGTEVATIEDGAETIIKSSPAKIIAYPSIILLEEQAIGGIDSLSARLLIYL